MVAFPDTIEGIDAEIASLEAQIDAALIPAEILYTGPHPSEIDDQTLWRRLVAIQTFPRCATAGEC